MPVYLFTGLSETGATVSGERIASSAEMVQQELSANGYLVENIKEKQPALRGFGRRGQRLQEFLLFNQEFKALIRAGLTIPEALEQAADRPDNPVLAGILSRVLEQLRQGKQLSEACAEHPDIFDGLYISSIKTGEKSGDLAAVLERYQQYLQHRIALQKKLIQAVTYPAFLLFVMGIILSILFVFVMPRFAQMYADFGAQLPLATRLLIGLVEHLYIVGPIAVVTAVAAYYGFRYWRKSPSGKLRWSRLLERLPVVGAVVIAASVAKFARTLSTLLSGGTPLVEALATTHTATESAIMQSRIEHVKTRVTEGGSLAEAFRETEAMPASNIKLIEVGEASGNLEDMLSEVAGFQEEYLDSRLVRLNALMEPVLMLLMGVFVGGVIIVMYLPIFHMADIIR